ncbi:hypothetical protein F2P81_010771 [Scophthalmus maximus]|uniref:Uncharacterized protein n=1 Tax=Scophthalmus maximus TaxID=52904 RepID=A0A6A4SWI5_SCOMX|nr:hypothetical protein F2P81_010771 [Scophthalmus maximus]
MNLSSPLSETNNNRFTLAWKPNRFFGSSRPPTKGLDKDCDKDFMLTSALRQTFSKQGCGVMVKRVQSQINGSPPSSFVINKIRCVHARQVSKLRQQDTVMFIPHEPPVLNVSSNIVGTVFICRTDTVIISHKLEPHDSAGWSPRRVNTDCYMNLVRILISVNRLR